MARIFSTPLSMPATFMEKGELKANILKLIFRDPLPLMIATLLF
jgi:hypothetical protein